MTQSFHHPNQFGAEGTDHINISSRSNSRLGKLLDPSYFKCVNYPLIGKFASVMNLWYWLRADTTPDVFRRAAGPKLQRLLKSTQLDNYVPNFRAIIAKATYDKIMEYPDTVREIRALGKDTRFLSYYVPNGTVLRVCSNYANVIIPITEAIVQAIQENREPDYSLFLPEAPDTTNHFLNPFLKTRFPLQYS